MGNVISFNGVDGSGKTTQIELLLKKYDKYIELVNGKKSFSDKRIADFNWWFIESLPEEFLSITYNCIKQRNELIKECKKPIILLDKGIKNFDARAAATLMVKGLNEEEAMKMVDETKYKYGITNQENLSLFFEIAKSTEERRKITEERKISTLDKGKHDIYSLYQIYQNQIINKQILNNDYQVFDASGSIDEVNDRLIKLIFKNNKVKK